MWLLNARTRKLEEFVDFREVRGKYAILSHTWGKEEITFVNIHEPDCQTQLGYIKVDFTCRQALEDGLDYVWIDTCCIDKCSSAELGKAINSMYLWYLNAQICYAYLADIDASKLGQSSDNHAGMVDSDFRHAASLGRTNGLEYHFRTGDLSSRLQQLLSRSKWFTRGWTLRELIAPDHIRFYDHRWTPLGTKTELATTLSHLTLIDRAILLDQRELPKASIAQKMSWAAHRTTSRTEDQAYCLMGIFEVNMPLLYGEGVKAFLRLQEEIVRTWDRIDHTILAWTGGSGLLLAPSPLAFAGQHHLTSWSLPQRDVFELSDAGLRVSVLADVHDCFDPEDPRFEQRKYVLVALNARSLEPRRAHIGLILKKRIHIETTDLRNPRTSDTEDVIYERQLGLKQIEVASLCNFAKVELTIARSAYHLPRTTNKVLVTSEDYKVRLVAGSSSELGESTILVPLEPSSNQDRAGSKFSISPRTEHESEFSQAGVELSLELVQRYDKHRLPELRLLSCRGQNTRYLVSFFEPDEEHIHHLVGLTAQRIFSKYTILGSEFMWHIRISHSR